MAATVEPSRAGHPPRITFEGYDVFYSSSTLLEPEAALAILSRGPLPGARAAFVLDPATASTWINLAPAEGLRPERTAPAMRRTPAEIEAELYVGRQLAEISSLEAGWLDGEGVAISPDVLKLARTVLIGLIAAGRGRPQIAPTPEGGVQAEWSYPSVETSVTFEASGEMYLFAMNLDTNETLDELLPRDYASAG